MSINENVNRRTILRAGASLAGIGATGLATGFGIGIQIEPARAQGAPTKINIVCTSSTPQLTLTELIKRQGYFKELGLDPTITQVTDGNRLVASLLSGDMDICIISGFGQIFPAVEKGAKMKIIAGANTIIAQAVYSAKPDIKTLKDLEGRVVGVGAPGSLLHHSMVAAMTKQGVDYTKVNFANVGSNADVFKAVVAGTVDAGPSTTDNYYEQEKFGVHSIAEMWKVIPEYPYQGSYATDSAIATKRDAIVRVLAAYAKLYRFMMSQESKQAYVDAYLAAAGQNRKQAEDLWRFNVEAQSYAVNLLVPDSGLEYLQNLNMKLEIQHRALAMDELRDMTLAQDAIKMIGGPVPVGVSKT
jgi:ABC-type nitrate/sulfonate/bicarbonate transport system substrate-binding protein